MRDILSWAHFITECQRANSHMTIWDAFYHGACLMHLDGLGLGSGLSVESAKDLKVSAENRLMELIPSSHISNRHGVDEPFAMKSMMFGAFPYFIKVGNFLNLDSSFDMTAPTTSLNTFRVLRAMQLKKPILLEGSPGVGKTSLVSALAAASGHKLVRINLSEQTDIADLMGSDLPVDSSTIDGPAFEWRDGVLLTAIKEGSWVLLDELNLASQSVLEGLNSCLDHRATVYIPELGRTFECPSSFRVFGAQNPLGQGGGRKGLPKSFLNRFTKVFVDALTDNDLQSIVTSRFGSLSPVFIDKMIMFNKEIQHEVVEMREYGNDGAPWEFNLRDVFRWSELLGCDSSDEAAAARDLYYQRFRTQRDRDRVGKTFEKHFGASLKPQRPPKFMIYDSMVQIGGVTLKRLDPTKDLHLSERTQQELSILFSNLMPMEAVARCVSLQWPCLLVGARETGKTSIVSSLAKLCNATLVEQCLSPSSDVSELVGGFEQVETKANESKTIADLCYLAKNVILADTFCSALSGRCWTILDQLERGSANSNSGTSPMLDISTEIIWKLADELCSVLSDLVEQDEKLFSHLGSVAEVKQRIRKQIMFQSKHGEHSADSGHFVWRDGILVEAMVKGYWLLLENVNHCPASVLDRLNSVTERNGFLLLSESGTQDGEEDNKSHRIIKPHKDFRIFLTMDPANGEISRAMRNRCVEIALLPGLVDSNSLLLGQTLTPMLSLSKTSVVDMIGQLQSAGIRSLSLASGVIENYVSEYLHSSSGIEETPSCRNVIGSLRAFSELLARGVRPVIAVERFMQISYEMDESEILAAATSRILESAVSSQSAALPANLTRNLHGENAALNNAEWEGRLLRVMPWVHEDNVHDFLCMALLPILESDSKAYEKVFESIENGTSSVNLACLLAQYFLEPGQPMDLTKKTSVLDGMNSQMAFAVRWMSRTLLTIYDYHPSCSEFEKFVWERIKQQFDEHLWTARVSKEDSFMDSEMEMTVLEASYFVKENILDGSAVPCSVTRLMFPYFLAFDQWVESILIANQTSLATLLPPLKILLQERDKLWNLLKDVSLDMGQEGFCAFDESEFIVQWQWLQKRMLTNTHLGPLVEAKYHRVKIMTEAIDNVIFGGHRLTWSPRSVRKRMMKPLSPCLPDQWDAYLSLSSLASGCSLLVDSRFDPFENQQQLNELNLQGLMSDMHPLLYVPENQKWELLGAISTLYLAWTENKSSSGRDWIKNINFSTSMKDAFANSKHVFELEVAAARVDQNIQTVESQVEAKVLDDLADASSTATKLIGYRSLKSRLLTTVQKMQLSALAEFWCVHTELELCAKLCRCLMECSDEDDAQKCLFRLVPQMKKLMDVVVSETFWAVSDMRTYQLLIWAIEGNSLKGFSFLHLLRSMIPSILSGLSEHSFFASFVCMDTISMGMEMPDMWVDDENPISRPHDCVLTNDNVVFGTSRLSQPVRTEWMLKTIGKQISFTSKSASRAFYTMENALYRESQLKHLVKMLSTSTVPDSKQRLYIFHYMLYDILLSVKEVFHNDDGNMDILIKLSRSPLDLSQLSLHQIKMVGDEVKSVFFDLYWLNVIQPLLQSLQMAWEANSDTSQYAHQSSLASVYLGMLRLHLLTPDTPLDPGRAPLAKVSLISRQLAEIRSRITAISLYHGFTRGDFVPDLPESCDLLSSFHSLSEKREAQKKKVVERTQSAPSFNELFREMKSFLVTVADMATVIDMLKSATERGDNVTNFVARTRNWQQTAAAYCRRLGTNFAAFEDITVGIVDSVRMIQDGLFDLTLAKSGALRKEVDVPGGALPTLYKFPMAEDFESIKLLHEAVESIAKKTQTTLDPGSSFECLCSLSLAILGRLLLKKTIVGLTDREYRMCSFVVANLTSSFQGNNEESNDGKNLEEIQEKRFREQFPDHRKDFENILQDPMDKEEHQNSIESKNLPEAKPFGKSLTDTQVKLLYKIYTSIFSEGVYIHQESIRKIAFHTSYAAAYEFQKNHGSQVVIDTTSESMGGHVFATSLSSIPKTSLTRVHPYMWDTSKLTDFQNEACPSVALAAAEPLERLLARTTQLLTAFPGHSILLGLGKVCEKVNKLDLMTTPIGKVMTGMEVILRHAQDWEQHASEKVKLGTPLFDIGRLISEWRKLELESWSALVVARQARRAHKAQKHWIRLHSILSSCSFSDSDIKDETPNKQFVESHVSPTWVWKGNASIRQQLSEPLREIRLDELKELVKALDTFVLTSPLGEFEERLNILKTCASELFASYNVSKTPWKLQKSRTLYSIWDYYSQYKPLLLKKLDAMRAPIEEKLKSETKLAKWDTQSYYALAESTERNQRKLMKILSEFDETLDLNVGILIQEENIFGLRDSIDSFDEFCTTFPSFVTMFPMNVDKAHDLEKGSTETWLKQKGSLELIPFKENIISISTPGHVSKIAKYVAKMKTRKLGQDGNSVSHARLGGDLASSFCQAIFDRIEALRTKATRPMKERALNDLFREMKNNGFVPTKWSTPAELKEVEQVFLLPKPNITFEGLKSPNTLVLDRAEQYYMRCFAEIHAFQSETTMLGSKYMTRREIDFMVNLGYSAMLVTSQQRCLVTALVEDSRQLDSYIDSFALVEKGLPRKQRKLKDLVERFDTKRELSFESLRQLALLIRSATPFIQQGPESDWARDTVSKLESLSDASPATRQQSFFVTSDRLLQIGEDCKRLEASASLVRAFRKECKRLSCLPLDSFDVCLDDIVESLELASEFKGWSFDVSQSNYENNETIEFDRSGYENFTEKLSLAIERTLISYQNLSKEVESCDVTPDSSLDPVDKEQEEKHSSIGDCHKKSLAAIASINLKILNKFIHEVQCCLCDLHDDVSIPRDDLDYCVGLLCNVTVLLRYLNELIQKVLEDISHFYSSSAKFNYIVLRVFRVLVAKGYCSDKSTEGEDEDGDGNIDGMKFEDENDGTGMGEGDGKKDVTDQIENEDQLAGLKSDEKNDEDKGESADPKQLNQEEAEQGMEMEADFDGEMYDLPEKPEDTKEEEEGDEEELDREMGDEANADDQVVDEKMWDDSDDDDNVKEKEEKFEEDSGVEGQAIEDAMRTKDTEEDQKQTGEEHDSSKEDTQENKADDNAGDEDKAENNEEEEQNINEDLEENYEDSHGVDVRGDERDENQDADQIDDQMELDEDLNLDDDKQADAADEADAGPNDGSDDDNNSLDNCAENNDGMDVEDTVDDEQDDDAENENTEVNPATGAMDLDKEENDDAEAEADDGVQEPIDNTRQDPTVEEAHGILSKDGSDAIADNPDNENQEESKEAEDSAGDPAGGKSQSNQTEAGGIDGTGFDNETNEDAEGSDSRKQSPEIPNPFKDPGDASKYWHRKLNVVDSKESEDDADQEDMETDDKPLPEDQKTGDFEYTSKEANSTQVLGDATEDEAVELEPQEVEDENNKPDGEEPNQKNENKENDMEAKEEKKKNNINKQRPKSETLPIDKDDGDIGNDDDQAGSVVEDLDEGNISSNGDDDEEAKGSELNNDEELITGTQVVSDLSRLKVGEDQPIVNIDTKIEQVDHVTSISTAEANEARAVWSKIQGETHSLSRRLCEKLRLVMEPLVASKLRGDYRTGKRINMKRVIGYIASGYRKDKIWLRRTKPAKRNYRVLLAVDDSESMKKSGAGEMALRAMATVAVGMNQLEVGELGVASFGEDMQLVHPFHMPFTSESGADVVRNFKFDQRRTRIALCVESAMAALKESGDGSSMQLVFLISDGRIERDSRSALKRLIREMMERNILLAMIIVEGAHKKKDSILNMKEVTFEKGKPIVKRFIEDYPFPYYIVLDDVTSLPEVLGDALKQWFEMLTHLQSSAL